MKRLHLADTVDRNQYSKFNSEIHVKQQVIVDTLYNTDNVIKLNKVYKQRVIDALNTIAFRTLQGDNLDNIKDGNYFIDNCPKLDEYELASVVNSNNILKLDNIDWSDLEELHDKDELYDNFFDKEEVKADFNETEDKESFDDHEVTMKERFSKINELTIPTRESKITDIWLKPRFPQFDVNDIWLEGMADGNHLVIRRSLPKIPRVQSDISVTTDFNDLKDEDFLKLFPNKILKPRFERIYYEADKSFYNVKKHPILGNIVMVDGFTYEQIVDNVVKYPHFYKLKRDIDDKWINFYTRIEIDGELYETAKIWNELPEAAGLPKDTQYMKEYVIRRYLLERDIKGIKHKFPIVGSLDPFITLFAPMDVYKELGYTDYLGIAKQCVKSRVSFYYTRNPIVRRLLGNE